MIKFYKILLAILVISSITFTASAQENYWSSRSDNSGITTDKAVARQSFPKTFRLFTLNIEPLRQELFPITGNSARHSTIITLPNADGNLEQFMVSEGSNFEPALQARFPEIRAFSGQGVTDRSAILKLSISPQGIQTMVFRADKESEFTEAYSQDHTVYAVFKSQRTKGAYSWTCSTVEQNLVAGLNASVQIANRPASSAGELKTMRLAQSVTAEYSNWYGAFNATQVALVLAGVNATMTRCNGVYEKDLAMHLNLIANTTNVFYYDPATDPYTFPINNWNAQLQATLTSVIGEANYDIGHLFGQSGGGGNAGCIGCVCVDGIKGSGITSPPDNIPQGDNFDIDYVVHEVGHQMGGTHSFSFQNEGGSSSQKEVGSGITIMGYAGITPQDVAPHSIDIFHETNIAQIQANMATKSCPVTTNITANNATPVVAPVGNFTIPQNTPFALTGSATDVNAGDVLTYCWEQNDNHGGQTGNNSVAYQAKPVGPNWLSFSPTTNPTRLCPKLSTILAGLSITPVLPGGDAIANIEALSTVARTLNFRLTVRDNHAYVADPPASRAVGQTAFTDMTVTVDVATGPFLITSQNAAISYPSGTSQTVTWSVNGTTGAPINCANVKISWSTDGGVTFPTVLAASTPNDGTENFTVPGTITTTGRIKVEAVGNIFFDINNASITVAAPVNGFTFNSPAAVTAACPAPNVMTSTNLTATFTGTFVGPVALTGVVVPAGPAVSFSNASLTPGSPSSTVSLTGMAALPPGTWTVTVTGTGAPAPTQTQNITFTINPGSGPAITVQPLSQSICSGSNANYSVTAPGATGYQWQVSTTGCGGSFSNIGGATTASYTVVGATVGQNGYAYQCIVTGQCGTTTSNCVTLTVNVAPAITGQPVGISVCSGSAATFTVAASGAGLTYQWQLSTTGVAGPYVSLTNIAPYSNVTTATLTINPTAIGLNGYYYRCVVSGTCPPASNSNGALLTVNSSVTVTLNPVISTICESTGTSFTASASGSGLNYQWEVSTDGGTSWNNVLNNAIYSGAGTPTLTLTNTPPTLNGYRYRCNITSPPCTAGITTSALLTVNTFPVITAQPANLTICEGANSTFSVTATTAVGSLSYQWQASTDGGTTWFNLVGQTTNTFSQTGVPAAQNGYRFRVIVTAGCGSSTTSAAIETVNTYPVFTISVPAVTCVSDPSFALSASLAGGTWSGPGVSGSTFVPSVATVGPKTVTYTATNAGCTKAVSATILVNECAERHRLLSNKLALTVYPIPNNGQFSMRLNSDLYTNLSMKVFGSDGRLYRTMAFPGLSFGSVIPVNLTSLISGTYYLYIYNSEHGFIRRVNSIIVAK